MLASVHASCAGEGFDVPSGSTTTTVATGGSLLTAIQRDIFSPTCAASGCHDPLTHSEGLVLSAAEVSFNALVGVPSACSGKIRVVPGEPSASYLLDKLGDGEALCGSRMPRNLPSLTTGELQLIRDWIASGAKPVNSVALSSSSSSTTVVTVTLTSTTIPPLHPETGTINSSFGP